MADDRVTISDLDVEKLVRDGLLNRDEAEALRASHQAETGTVRMEALPSTAGNDSGENKDFVKEQAARHQRHWVRVTRLCNQRCTFCLDSMNQDGTMIDVESLKAYILLGRRMGRERLILSGGEASVHPNFIELIRYGRQVGYDWIQTVTNGMMFSYKKFANAAAEAGLNEATVSMHGHTAHLHDKLTGTPLAFVTGIKGIQNLQATGKVVVNIDVVINKQNYKFLPEVIEYYYNMGIREFDLLHIVPFGRGFDEHRHSLFFDLNDAVPYFRKAFAWADKPGMFIWTNRLPVTYLEGSEKLIQEPHKLTSEFDGGRHNFEGYLRRGLKPDCHGERCDFCFLDGPCRQTLFPYREQLMDNRFPIVRLDSHQAWAGTPARERFLAQKPEWLQLTARTAEDAAATLATLPFESPKIAVELDAGADATPLTRLAGVQRVVIKTVADAERALIGKQALPAPMEVELEVDRPLAAWLLARPSTCKAWGSRLICTLPNHEYLSESQAADPEPETLRKLARLGLRIKNLPECVVGSASTPGDHSVLDAKLLDGAGDLHLDRYVNHYITREYYAKSVRCGLCSRFDQCKGIHINYLRNHGFAQMTPLDEQGQPRADAQNFDQLADRLKLANAGRSRREQSRVLGLHRPERGAVGQTVRTTIEALSTTSTAQGKGGVGHLGEME